MLKLSFISHIENHDWNFNISIFAIFIRLEWDATSVYKMLLTAYKIILFSRIFYISLVYRVKSVCPKQYPEVHKKSFKLNGTLVNRNTIYSVYIFTWLLTMHLHNYGLCIYRIVDHGWLYNAYVSQYLREGLLIHEI